MSETKNYGLYLEDSDQTKFKDWRERMNGSGKQSNMEKIDAALGEKANHSKSFEAVLLASAWSGVVSPFTQVIAVDGLGAKQNGSIAVAQKATVLERDCARMAMLSVIGQGDGALTIAADGEMPEVNIPVTVIFMD